VHNNYFFLRTLTSALGSRLSGAVVSECFSQNKDELILRFEVVDGNFFIKASLLPTFSCLSFPDRFERARKNSVDIFGDLIGQRLQGIQQHLNERSFALRFTNEFTLLFKMYGTRANVVLFQKNKVSALFKNNLRRDAVLDLSTLDRSIDWTFDYFLTNRQNLSAAYFTFGKVVWQYLAEKHFHDLPAQEQWSRIQEVLNILEHPTYAITRIEKKLTFSLLPLGESMYESDDPIAAINRFFSRYVQQDAFEVERSSVLASLQTKLRASENYVASVRRKSHELQSGHNYKHWADLIMANLHDLKVGPKRVILQNFYDDNRLLEIKLKQGMSPAKNAEVYYAKSRNQQKEILRLQDLLVAKEKEVRELRDQLHQLQGVTDLKTLRLQVGSSAAEKGGKEKVVPLPYHTFEHQGFRILVGKNAQSNDKLTQKHSYKEDLWLHAKDVAGSHVLIKHQAGRNFPRDVIERAAEIAAYYSKRKTETLCPVIFTARKYVRKRKGDPAGAVVVEREQTILVEPKR
jgi:predicted ribosome quality control (RQC) complex YloA/Tae2 family protein